MTETATRGRKPVSMEDKVANAKAGKLTKAQSAFFNWASETTGVTLDPVTFVLASTLYQDYIKTGSFQEAAAARKLEREKAKTARLESQLTKFEEMARKLGKRVNIDIEDIEDDDDSDDEDDE